MNNALAQKNHKRLVARIISRQLMGDSVGWCWSSEDIKEVVELGLSTMNHLTDLTTAECVRKSNENNQKIRSCEHLLKL